MNLGQNNLTLDLDVVDGQLVLVGQQFGTQQREIEEHTEQRLRTHLGEWFANITIGIPYFEEVFAKPTNVALIESILINEILGTPGVIRLLAFNMDINKFNRTLIVTPLTIESTAGVIEFGELELA